MTLEWKQHPLLSPPSVEEMSRMDPAALVKLWEVYHDAIDAADKDPYRYGFNLPIWKEADEQLSQFSEMLISGGNRCLAGEQEIYDPVKCKMLRVDSITEPFSVYAWDEEQNRMVIADAEVPFRKPVAQLMSVLLGNGQTLFCSEEHRVLTPTGWKAIKQLSVGSRIAASILDMQTEYELRGYLPSQNVPISDICLSRSLQDAWRWNQKAQDSLGNCSVGCHSCDAQPQLAKDNGQDVSPSPICAPEYTSPCDSIFHQQCFDDIYLAANIQGDLGKKHERIPACSQYDHHSNLDVLRQRVGRFFDSVCHAFCKPCKLLWQLCAGRIQRTNSQQFSAESNRQQYIEQFSGQDSLFVNESWGGVTTYYTTLVKCDYLRSDVVWDFNVPIYHNYLSSGVLSHNSSKTSYAAKAVVRAAIENDGAIIMCFSQNADVSVRQQQSAVYDALPEEFKRKILGSEENVSYSRKNGFSKGSCILPGSLSIIIFKTYAQFLNDDTILEGAELGSRDAKWTNIGAWCDEYLGGPELLATLRFRLATRNSKLIVTFTPIDGYTEVVRDYIGGAKTVVSKPADLLNGRMVPIIQHSVNRHAAIIYFHTKDNPFGGYDRIANDLKNRPEEEILCRAYGVPTKSFSCQFPNFNTELNVLKHDKIPRADVTRYMVLDPAGRKNWFMCWIAVDSTDTYYVYREWPDVSVGDWAKWHGGKWVSGEGQKGLGYGIKQYVDMIMAMEAGETIFERLIDPRLGAAKYATQNGASSIIEDLADAGMCFIPAPGLEIDDGIQALQTKMAYNRKMPIDGVNRPHFYISERCQNIIMALQEYTGEGGPEESHKDPIDVIRYAAIDGIRNVPATAMQRTRRTKGGY